VAWTLVERDSDAWLHFLGKVWHMTWPDPAQAIFAAGYIEPSSPSRTFSMPQTQNSYALMRGYVAVFDFRSADLRLIKDEAMKWAQYFWGSPYRVGLSIEVEKLPKDLIPWQVAQRNATSTMWIPYFEAWSPDPIPLSAIDRVTVTAEGMVFTTELQGSTDWAQLSDDIKRIGELIVSTFEEARERDRMT